MANKLEQARKIINEVDAAMAELFVKRMHAAEMVYEHKKEYGLPILDQKREDQVIASNASRIPDETIKGYYIDYLKNMMSLSRAYQYRIQNGLKVAYSGVALYGRVGSHEAYRTGTDESEEDAVKVRILSSLARVTQSEDNRDEDMDSMRHSRGQSRPSRAVISSVTTRSVPFTSSTVRTALFT